MRILITGGSGTFGKAFTKRVLDLNWAERICIYSRGEYPQHLMRQQFNNDPRLRMFIGDVRDKDRLRRAMEGNTIVIHAAALKRIEVGEYCPDELVKTNVWGAMNVIEACHEAKVRNVVALSTDKAASPFNAYGASKLLSEKLFIAANNMYGLLGPSFAVCRYGNVSGSTGSVIPLWRAMIAEGKKITVTDPDATRYWMTADEAVDGVLKSIGRRDMAVPSLAAYRVADLAEAMGGDYEIVGMRPGEKQHEMMVSEHEAANFRMTEAMSSDKARRMTVDELREGLKNV